MKKSDVMTVETSSERLRMRLQAMAKIGATANGGCNRQALTDEDKAGRDLFIQWCENVSCTMSIERIGNIFARRPGRDHNLPPVIVLEANATALLPKGGCLGIIQPDAVTKDKEIKHWRALDVPVVSAIISPHEHSLDELADATRD